MPATRDALPLSADRVSLSDQAIRYAEATRQRGAKILAIRELIRQDLYDTPERLDAALDRLIDAAGSPAA